METRLIEDLKEIKDLTIDLINNLDEYTGGQLLDIDELHNEYDGLIDKIDALIKG